MFKFAILLLLPALVACQTMSGGGESSDETTKSESKAAAPSRPTSDAYGLPGFAVYEDEGRLWVFRENSGALKEYRTNGEPAKRVTLVGAGPDGRTLMGAETETLQDYMREAVRQ